ncbi:MAG: hypothetical protein M5U12_09540 [Verrucomicrobia bacterium]|nr:hypothetical protein [Verrucomicrobiota bacterium]
MTKHVRVDFYRLDAAIGFDEQLRGIRNLGGEEARNWSFKDGVCRLRVLEEDGEFMTGDIIRIRLNEPAFVAKVSGGERPVLKDEDEGMGETNAFLYSPSTRYLVFQKNRGGIMASAFGFYVQQMRKLEKGILFEPVLKATAVEQLARHTWARRLEFGVVVPKLDNESVKGAALNDIIDAAQQLGSYQMKVSFGMGRVRKGKLAMDRIVAFVKQALALRAGGHEIKKLEVAASAEAGGHLEVLDFIDATVKVQCQVEPAPQMDEFYRRRIECLRDAWRQRLGDLI